jgi:hypothetical protein
MSPPRAESDGHPPLTPRDRARRSPSAGGSCSSGARARCRNGNTFAWHRQHLDLSSRTFRLRRSLEFALSDDHGWQSLTSGRVSGTYDTPTGFCDASRRSGSSSSRSAASSTKTTRVRERLAAHFDAGRRSRADCTRARCASHSARARANDLPWLTRRSADLNHYG